MLPRSSLLKGSTRWSPLVFSGNYRVKPDHVTKSRQIHSTNLSQRWLSELPSMSRSMDMDGSLKRIKETNTLAFGAKTDEVRKNVALSVKSVSALLTESDLFGNVPIVAQI